MTFQWIKQPDNSARALLFFFNGWGMTSAAVAHLLPPQGMDILIISDYRSLEEAFPSATKQYESYYLAAWSIGVWAAELLAQQHKLPHITESIALAGSPHIRHDLYGIPIAIFDQTLEAVSGENRNRFNRRMCGGKKLKALFEEFSRRPTDDIREELQCVQQIEKTKYPIYTPTALPWTKAFVAQRDRIVPYQNLLLFWQSNNTPVYLLPEADHYLFSTVDSWETLFYSPFEDEKTNCKIL